MPRFEELREALSQILQERQNCYWLCYQILNRLRERNPEILEDLERTYGTGYGRGGGSPYRPDSAIAHCPQDWPEFVEVRYLLGRDLRIGYIMASDDVMGIYR